MLRGWLLTLLGCVPLVGLGGDWPQWRGGAGNGSADEKGMPERVDPAAAKWVAVMPGPGHATPVVSGDRVYLTSTDKESKGVLALCYRLVDGVELWRKRLGEDIKAPQNNGATPSPVTDGKHVWFLLGSGELVALDVDGAEVWKKDLVAEHGDLCTKFGYSSSPLLWEGRLYVQILRRAKTYRLPAPEVGPLHPLVLAFDPLSGKELWKQERRTGAVDESCESYTTPVGAEVAGRKELLIHGGDRVSGHDPATGVELWRWDYNAGRESNWRLIPTPVVVGDLVVAMLPRGGPLVALKGGAKGELAADAPVWTYDERTSDSGSALVYDGLIYILQSDKNDPWRRGSKSSPGIFLLVVDPATGKEVGRCQVDKGGAWRASPTGVDGKIYVMSEDGEVVVLSAGRAPKVVSRHDYGDRPSCATVVAANGRLLIRTAKRLVCF